MTDARPRSVLPSVPPPRKPNESDRTRLLTLALVGICPPLLFLAPIALVLAQTEIRDLRRRGRAASGTLRAARAVALLGTALLATGILCFGGRLAPLA